jgi:cytochrome b6-f complex iron-sulfur subunit
LLRSAAEVRLSITRRRFLVSTGQLGVGALLLDGFAGCQSTGGPTDGSVDTVNGQATLTFARYPQLMTVGDGVVVDSSVGKLAVLRTATDSVVALSAVCTHAGCTVEVQSGPSLFCPCHGSEFSASGGVVSGPARRSLLKYPAMLAADGVTVTLG